MLPKIANQYENLLVTTGDTELYCGGKAYTIIVGVDIINYFLFCCNSLSNSNEFSLIR